MTHRGLIVLAQALDNTSANPMEVGGSVLAPDDEAGRQAAMSAVSGVQRDGRLLFMREGVRLSSDGRHFVLEVPGLEPDAAGRLAPLICSGPIEGLLDNTAAITSRAAISGFATRIGRRIAPEHLDLLDPAFSALKTYRVVRALQTVAASVIVAGAIWAVWPLFS